MARRSSCCSFPPSIGPRNPGLSCPRSAVGQRAKRRQSHLEGSAYRRWSCRARNHHRARAGMGAGSCETRLGRDSMAALQRAALKILALTNDVAPFEARHAEFVRNRRGLRMPLLPTGFDACAGASSASRSMSNSLLPARRDRGPRLAARRCGDMSRPFPRPQGRGSMDVLHLGGAALFRAPRRIFELMRRSAAQARRRISAGRIAAKTSHRPTGIGLGRQRYVLMRGGFRRRGACGR